VSESAVTGRTPAGNGCSRYSRDDLELAAIARSDPDAPVADGLQEHLSICPICRAIVDRIAADNEFLAEVAKVATAPSTVPSRLATKSEDEGGSIAGYRLGDEIHRGAQGAVYRAEQLATRRICAVKMLLRGRFAGDRERIRFEREVEVVARMRHPSIVTLYESGISRDGEPWFAMELVEGDRLDAFVRKGGLAPRRIAELMKRVAEGVAYAHRRGVIHRDLKPGNIVVDAEGVPRVLDFGLARSDEDGAAEQPGSGTTLVGEFLGTFAYAAPEQLSGDPTAVDSRCDLYALGVVMYECLAGKRPFEGARSIAELVTQKTMSTPERPSVANRSVDRDLDVIALRLLSADPARRYDTADALVEDLARYLDGRPILARDDSVAYVVRKTLRRHWLASSAGAALLLTIVVSGIALAIAYARAERERVRSERTLASFRDAVGSVNPESVAGSARLTVEQFLELIEQNAATELASEPAVLAGVLDTIGIVHLGFEDANRAEKSLRIALESRRALYARGDCSKAELAESLHNMGRVLILQKKLTEAEADYREALSLRKESFGLSDPRTMLTGRHLAACIRRQKRLDEARTMFGELLERARTVTDYPPLELAAIINSRAFIDMDEGRFEQALAGFREALAAVQGDLAADDYRVGRSFYNVASVEEKLGRRVEAKAHATQAVAILRKRKGGDSATVLQAEALLARLSADPEDQR
jgi:tRNA A-37 threonylcarbamoyl transferase component Bud32/tetratricopeptide (TPR) repeat protein